MGSTFEPTSEATQGPQIFAMDADDYDDSPRRGFFPESSRHGTWAVHGCSEGDTHSFCTKLVSVFCLHHSFLKKKQIIRHRHAHTQMDIYIYIIYIIYYIYYILYIYYIYIIYIIYIYYIYIIYIYIHNIQILVKTNK